MRWHGQRARLMLASALVAASVTAGYHSDLVQNWGAPPMLEDTAGTPLEIPGVPSYMDAQENCLVASPGLRPWLPLGKPRDARWRNETLHVLHTVGGMPLPAALEAVDRLQTQKQQDGWVSMTNLGGTASDGVTYSNAGLGTFRNGERPVACVNTRMNFPSDGHTNNAVRYLIEHQGRVWHVVEYLACGNVGIVWPGPLLIRPVPGPGALVAPPQYFAPLPPPTARGGGSEVPPTSREYRPVPAPHEVPEPGTLALAAIALIGAFNWRKK